MVMALRQQQARSRMPGRPVVPARGTRPIEPGAVMTYRIPIVPKARHIAAGKRIDRLPGRGGGRTPNAASERG